MKKSVLSIVAIAFAAVSVLSSCDKNDDGYGQSAKTTTVQSNSNSTSSTSSSTTTANEATYHGKCFFMDDSFAQYGTFKIVVSDGNQTAEYDLAAQGKHGTFTLPSTNNESMTATGYLLEVVLPTKQNLTAKVTFVPNDKAKALTENDEVGNVFAFANGQGNNQQLDYKFFISKATQCGDRFMDYAETAADLMSLNRQATSF